jgi:hypothetical protein
VHFQPLEQEVRPYDLREMAVRMIQRKKAEGEVNTYEGHIWMIDPRLKDERTNSLYNDNHVFVLFCHDRN